jgi:hypothetical protein
MSDKDLELFKASLPRLINQPGGNAQILSVMRGMAEYTASQARIAEQVVTGAMSREEGVRRLMALPNPLAGTGDQAAPAAAPAAQPAPAAPANASAAAADPLASAREKVRQAVAAKGGRLTADEARAMLTEEEFRALSDAAGRP